MSLKNYVEIPISKLVAAKWNYKKDDDDRSLQLMEKLKKNLARNGQIENLIVRTLGRGKYEVVNGNHRLKALKDIGEKSAICFDLGKITLAHAQRIAVETNETKFDADPTKFGELLKSLSIDFDVEDLLSTLPMDEDEMAEYIKNIDPMGARAAIGSTELNQSDFDEFDNTCPKCGFQFDDKKD